MRTIRIFISSPSDLTPERQTTVQVIERLHNEFKHFFDVKPVFWEHEPLLATEHFQEGLISPAECDLMVCMLWSRLGSPLPKQFDQPISGDESKKRSITGTEWEFEKAKQQFDLHGSPRIIFYRKTAPVKLDINDSSAIQSAQSEKVNIDAFFDQHFHNQDDGHTFKNAYWPFESLDEFESQMETHLRNLLKELAKEHRRNDSDEQQITWHKGSPFRGLRAFELEHASIFFGRSRARSQIFEQFQNQIKSHKAFLMVLGMSGSGKSSLVKAGVQPLLMSPKVIEGVAECRWAQFKPSDSPDELIVGLARALFREQALPESAPDKNARETIIQQIKQSPHALEAHIFSALNFIKQTKQYRDQFQVKLLIVIDQFEELFTLPGISETDRKELISLLHSLVSSGHSLVVCTMRSDFFAQCEAYPELIELMHGNGQFHLSPPTGEEIEQMIVKPAQAAGIAFEKDDNGVSLAQIIRESSSKHPSALPLLSFTLDELYRRRNDQGVLTFEAYDELGGLEGAIANRAEDVFSHFDRPTLDAFTELLPSLVTIHSEDSDTVTARSVNWSFVQQNPIRQKLVETLVNERLLVSQSQIDSPDTNTVRFTHEALLQNWKRVKDWVAFNLEQLKVRARLTTHARYWEASNRLVDELLTEGTFYHQIIELSNSDKVDLSTLEIEYIVASKESIKALEYEQQLKKTKDAKFKKMLSYAASIAAVFLVVFVYQIYSNQQSQAAFEKVKASQAIRQQEYYNGQMVKLVQQELDKGDHKKALSWALNPKPLENYTSTYGQSRQILYTALNQYPHLMTVDNQFSMIKHLSLFVPGTDGGVPKTLPFGQDFIPPNSDFGKADFDHLKYYFDEDSNQLVVFNVKDNRIEGWSAVDQSRVWKWQANQAINSVVYHAASKSWIFLLESNEVKNNSGPAIINVSKVSGETKIISYLDGKTDLSYQFQKVDNSTNIALLGISDEQVMSIQLLAKENIGLISATPLISLLSPEISRNNAISMNWKSPITLTKVNDKSLIIGDSQRRFDVFNITDGQFIDRLDVAEGLEPLVWNDGILFTNGQSGNYFWQPGLSETEVKLPFRSYKNSMVASENSQRLYFVSQGNLVSIDYNRSSPSTSENIKDRFSQRTEIAKLSSTLNEPQLLNDITSPELLYIIVEKKLIQYDIKLKKQNWKIDIDSGVTGTEINAQFIVLKYPQKDRVVFLKNQESKWIEKNDIQFLNYRLDDNVAFSIDRNNQLSRILLLSNQIEMSHSIAYPVKALSVLKNGLILTEGDHRLDLWQTDSEQEFANQEYITNGDNFTLSEASPLAAYSKASQLTVINQTTGRPIYQQDLQGDISHLFFSQTGMDLYVILNETSLHSLNIADSQLKNIFTRKTQFNNVKLFPKKNVVVVFGDENDLEVRELDSGKYTYRFIHWAGIKDAFYADGESDKLVTLTDDNTFNVWDMKTGNFVNRLSVGGQIDMASKAGDSIAFVTRYSRNETQLYDPVTDRTLGEIPYSRDEIKMLKVSPSFSSVGLLLNSNLLKIIRLDIDEASGEISVSKDIQSVANVKNFIFADSGDSVVYKRIDSQINAKKAIHFVRISDFSSDTIRQEDDLLRLRGTSIDGQLIVVDLQEEKEEGQEEAGDIRTAYFDLESGEEILQPTERSFSDEYVEHIERRAVKAIALGKLGFADKVPVLRPLPDSFLTQEIIDINAQQKLFVTRGQNNTLGVWNMDSNQLIAEFSNIGAEHRAYTTLDGTHIVIAEDGKMSIRQLYPEPIEDYGRERLAN